MKELTEKQKRIVVKFARDWPKTLDPKTLVLRLDAFAKAILEAEVD